MKKSVFLLLLTAISPLFGVEWRKEKQASPIEQVVIAAPQTRILLEAMESAPKNTLFIFDIGDVLLVNEDAILCHKNTEWLLAWIAREAPQMGKEEIIRYIAIVEQAAKRKLVSPAFLEIIKKGQEKGKVIVLSKYFVGPINDHLSFEDLRGQSLTKVGIDLGDPFPQMKTWKTEDKTTDYRNGLICTSCPLKGPVLIAFLKELGWSPKHIVFIDDQQKQCESIVAAAKELQIPAQCFHYTESVERSAIFDENIGEFQMHYLMENRRWMSDEEAKKVLQAKAA